MIPSRYLYPVISLVLIWAGSLLGVYQYATAEDNSEAYERYQAELIEKLHEQNYRFFEYETIRFTELLQEESRSVFRPVLPVIEANMKLSEAFRKENINSLEQDNKFNAREAFQRLKQIHRSRATVALSMIDNNVALYEQEQTLFGLRPEEISFRTEQLFDLHQELTDLRTLENLPTSFSVFASRVSALETELELFRQKLAQDIMYSFAGRTICFSSFHLPSVLGANAIAQRGQPFLLPISAIEVDLLQDSKNFTVVIDGQRYPFNKDGYAEYPAPTNERGAHQIPVMLQIRNPLTGAVKTSDAQVMYYVE